MEGIFEWVKGIAFYLILLTVVSHLIPGKKYEKYVRLFGGMILIILVIRPITGLIDKEGNFDARVTEIFQEEVVLDEGLMQELEQFQEKEAGEQMSAQMEAYCEQEALRLGLHITDFQVSFDGEGINRVPESISLVVECASSEEESMEEKQSGIDRITVEEVVIGQVENRKEGQEQQKQLRSILAQYYGMQEEQVEIRGQ